MKRSGPLQRHTPLRRTRTRKKAPRRLKSAKNDTAHRRLMTTLPCISCGREPTDELPNQPAHMTFGPNEKGTALKTNDDHVVPLCGDCHPEWDEHRGRYAGWSKRRRWLQARIWVSWISGPTSTREAA